MGMYGIAVWLKEPRATQDFDVLVPMRQVKKAATAIQAIFPELVLRDTPVVTRLLLDDEPIFAIMKPHHALFKEVFNQTTLCEVTGIKVPCPNLEMSLALKFFSMTGPFRDDIKAKQDALDFIRIIRHNRNIKESELVRLAEMAYPGGGKEVLQKVEIARSGKPFTI